MYRSNPSLLRYRRGTVDGHKFFSRTPFRSGYFVIVTAICLACIILAAFITYRNWDRLTGVQILIIFQVAWGGIAGTWWGALQSIDRVRQLYAEGSITEVEPGSPLDVALAVAAGAITHILFCFSITVAIVLYYIGYLLAHCL